VFRPGKLVSLVTSRNLTSDDVAPDGGLRIGAMTPLAVVERSAAVGVNAPVIARTMRTLSNIRCATWRPSAAASRMPIRMDLPPVLIALGAHVVAASPAGERMIPARSCLPATTRPCSPQRADHERGHSGAGLSPRRLSQVHDARGA